MRPSVLLAIFAATLAGFALAGGPTDPAAAEAVRQFERDRGLLTALVEGGVNLASDDDPLKRAEVCTDLVDQLARALQQSAVDKDLPRADALGRHVQKLLVWGVARNFDQAHFDLPPGSARAVELQRLWKNTERITQDLDEGLRNAGVGMSGKMEPLRNAVRDGRAAVERVVKSKRPAPGKLVSPGP